MKPSRFFAELSKTYRAEIEDHSTDSEGKDVLQAQLRTKRAQFAELLPMMEFAPEMVALCFHKGLRFTLPRQLDHLVAQEPDDFPSWDEVAQAVDFTPWAQPMAERALAEEGGAQFLAIVAGLEYLEQRHGALHAAPARALADADEDGDGGRDAEHGEHGDDGAHGDRHGRHDEHDDEPEHDLEQAGADWLAEQGFDRLD